MKKLITLIILSISLIPPIIASEGFDFIFDDEIVEDAVTSSSFDTSGTVSSGLNAFIDYDNLLKSEIEPFANLNLVLDYNNPSLLATVDLYLPALEENSITYKDVLKELSLTYYISDGKIQAGYFIHRWGVVDTARVVDVINANDYSSGFSMNQLEMKISEPMILTQLYFDEVQLEFVYKPIFTPINLSSSGRWNTSNDISESLTITNSTSFIEPNTNTLEYGSFGTRFAMPIRSVDTAIMYYRGYYQIPGYKYTIVPSMSPPYDVSSIETIYTMMNIIGTELNYVTGPFTFAGEAALYISEDLNSNDASLYNNRLSYTGSISYKIRNTSSYITASYNGTSIFGYDDTNSMDVDTASGSKQDHNIIVGLHVPLLMDKLLVEAGITYQIPTKGYALLSKIDYTLKDDITLRLNVNLYGTFDNNEDSLYKTWDDNDSLSISLNYQF
jgi:hypothetical protein